MSLRVNASKDTVAEFCQHQPHGPFPDFRGITFVSVHCSILSRNGVSGKPGAVHNT